MRGAFVAGLFAGVALGALVVLASQEQNRKVIVIQAGRLADQARSMMNRSANQVVTVATDVASNVAESVMEAVEDAAEMA
ncbi:MAG TPA: hypothetical protein VK191_16895 [Symbiobacteriaceae bacterium]|nr:hypothetical protein [Symbiobacteriaceae bacterium]